MKTASFDLGFSFESYGEPENIRNVIHNKSWWLLSNLTTKETYIFKKDNLLGKTGNIVKTKDGIVSYANYSYVSENRTIIIEDEGNRYMIKPVFLGKEILILRIEGKEGYALLINEKYQNRFLSNDIDTIQVTLSSMLEKEMKIKSYALKKELSYDCDCIKLLCRIIPFFLIAGMGYGIIIATENIAPDKLKLKIAISAFFAVLGLAIIGSVFISNWCERQEQNKIQLWKKNHPNYPLNKFL